MTGIRAAASHVWVRTIVLNNLERGGEIRPRVLLYKLQYSTSRFQCNATVHPSSPCSYKVQVGVDSTLNLFFFSFALPLLWKSPDKLGGLTFYFGSVTCEIVSWCEHLGLPETVDCNYRISLVQCVPQFLLGWSRFESAVGNKSLDNLAISIKAGFNNRKIFSQLAAASIVFWHYKMCLSISCYN